MSRSLYRQAPGRSSDEDRRISRSAAFPNTDEPVPNAVFTVATLPSYYPVGTQVYVSDASGGPLLAFWDGTNWKQVHSPATTVT